jgi:hypothetical protein
MPLKKDLALMEMFSKISEAGLTPNEFYLLCCMRENVGAQHINIHQDLRTLQEKDWIAENMMLQPKAMSLLAVVDSFFKVHKKKTSTQLLGKEFTDNMVKYNELFPKKKAGSGKYMRSSIKNIETAFRWFFENHDYTWDVIIEATTKYLLQQEVENYKFTRTSVYFIRKHDKGIVGSDLADWCEITKSGEDPDESKIFTEKVV